MPILKDPYTGNIFKTSQGEIMTVSGIIPSGSVTLTNTQVTDVEAFATAQVIDNNLLANNIKKDVTILGVTGTLDAGDVETYVIPYQYENSSISSFQSNALGVMKNAFERCRSLTTVTLPRCTSVAINAFNRCYSLNSISLPECEYVGQGAFYSCNSLPTISLPKCSYISEAAFQCCSKLSTVYLMSTSVVSLYNSNAFSYTPMTSATYTGKYGSIYVPASLFASYKSDTTWKAFSSRFVSVQ